MLRNWGNRNKSNLSNLSLGQRVPAVKPTPDGNQRSFRHSLPERHGFTNAKTKTKDDSTVTTTYTDASNNNVEEFSNSTQLKLPNMLTSFTGYVLSIVCKL